MMKKTVIGFALVFFVIAMAIMACGITAQEVATPVYIVVTATPAPTDTPTPTFTPIPIPTQPPGFGTRDELERYWESQGFFFYDEEEVNPDSGEPQINGENGTVAIQLSGYPYIIDMGMMVILSDWNAEQSGENLGRFMDFAVPTCGHCISWMSDALKEGIVNPYRDFETSMYYENVHIKLFYNWDEETDDIVVVLRILDEQG